MIHAPAAPSVEAAPRSRFETFRVAKPQKAFATAFAVFATALAGCASGLGAGSHHASEAGRIARVEEGAIVAAAGKPAGAEAGFVYTIRLPTGELVAVTQPGEFAMPAGTPVLIEYGANARVVPQDLAYNS